MHTFRETRVFHATKTTAAAFAKNLGFWAAKTRTPFLKRSCQRVRPDVERRVRVTTAKSEVWAKPHKLWRKKKCTPLEKSVFFTRSKRPRSHRRKIEEFGRPKWAPLSSEGPFGRTPHASFATTAAPNVTSGKNPTGFGGKKCAPSEKP